MIQIFQKLNVPFETVDVISDPEIREGVKQFTSWPTIPQVFINGKFIGGCDIVKQLYAKGELEPMIKKALGVGMRHAFQRVTEFLRRRLHSNAYFWIVLLALFFVLLTPSGGGEPTREQPRTLTATQRGYREWVPVEMSGAAANPGNGRGGNRTPQRKPCLGPTQK